MHLRRLILNCFLLFMVNGMALAGDVQPGLWSITLSMSAAGTEQAFGPFEKTQCFTEADARDPGKLFADVGGGCTYGNRNYQSGRFTFTVQCGGAIPMAGSGSVEYNATSFQGELNLKANIPNAGAVETRSRVSGSRIGDC